MSSPSHKLRDLQWFHQAIRSQNSFNSISFYLSQPTSSCHQETDQSITINISDHDENGRSQFARLLTALADGSTPLLNLEFHGVAWDPHLMRIIGNLDVKRLVFRQNKLGVECISELAEILKKSEVMIKEITVSDSRIGSAGASLIASALRVNASLEDLQIWEDSIGSKGAEELSKMIEANSSLKQLTILDTNTITTTPLISAVLARNRSIEVHVWSGISSKVVELVPEKNTLRIYRQLSSSGAGRRVACALCLNTTVKTLDLTGVRLKSRWAKEFRWVLEHNRSLKEVNFSKTCLRDKGVVYVAAGLFKNKSLETLFLDGNWFSGIGLEHLLCPLTRFSSLQTQANTTLKTVTFGGGRTKIGRVGLAAILRMITSNQTVTRLGIYDDETLKPDDIARIFKNLERNVSLKWLSLQGCKGVDGELVLKTIMETLHVNPWIEEIDLSRTPLHNSGKTEPIYLKLGQNAKADQTEIDSLKDMPMTVPKSCRVFLCGQENTGKTTLCNSISQSFSSSKLPYMEHVKALVNPVEQAVRTPGMKVKMFKDEDAKISVWNLGGYHEFYSFHDLMFPGHGSASVFVIVCSLFGKASNREPKTPGELEQDLQYWLRFIVSNSKRAARQCLLPNVTVVLTHHDKIHQPSQNYRDMVNGIQGLRDKFVGFVEFYPTVFTVDARSSASVSKLAHHLRKTCKTVLERAPRVYEVCNDLVEIMANWRSENHNQPAIKWNEFCDLCQVKVPTLRVRSRNNHHKSKIETRRRAIATCLHSIGEVTYFEELGIMILDHEWFCADVLTQIVGLDVRRPSSSNEHNGFVTRKELEKILKRSLHSQIPGMGSKVFDKLEPSDLVRMMLKLELCYEQDPSDPDSLLLFPSILEGRGRTPRWQLTTPNSTYVGRHLECHDSSNTFLTPGFFSRLQVHLHNKIIGLKNQHGATYCLERHLVSISINGIHVRVELGGQYGYYIDVLACSAKSLTEILRLFQQLIYPAIHSLCQGLTLTENILRPECVKNLTPPRHRRTQLVPLPELKQALLSLPADSMYDYQHTWSSVFESGKPILSPGFDFARDLLSDDDFREVLHRRYHDLYNLAVELQVPVDNDGLNQTDQSTEPSKIDPSFVGIAKGVEEVLKRLKIIEQEIRDLKQEIQGLRYYEHRLLTELHRKVNYLLNYNVQVEERKVPNMLYFVTTENFARRLVTTIISGMTALRLHMLCEFRREMHVVEDQIGCELIQVDNSTVRCLAPYLKKFMKLLTFAMKIGAHLAAGMGGLIPDLSREVANLVESPLVYGAAGAAVMGAAAAERRRGSSLSRDIQQDLRVAQQWIVDFLRSQGCSTGKEIAEKFGLWRVRYRDDGQIAWICRRHMYTRANEVIEVPM